MSLCSCEIFAVTFSFNQIYLPIQRCILKEFLSDPPWWLQKKRSRGGGVSTSLTRSSQVELLDLESPPTPPTLPLPPPYLSIPPEVVPLWPRGGRRKLVLNTEGSFSPLAGERTAVIKLEFERNCQLTGCGLEAVTICPRTPVTRGGLSLSP